MAISNGTNGTHANGTNGAAANGTPSLDFSTFYNIIDGKPSKTASTRHSINPATQEPNPEVPVSTEADVDRAVAAAKAAFPAWSEVPVEERRKKLHAFADAIQAHSAEFIKLLVQEQGKPVNFFFFSFLIFFDLKPYLCPWRRSGVINLGLS